MYILQAYTTFSNDFNMAPSRPGNGQVTANEPRSSMIVFCIKQKSNASPETVECTQMIYQHV